MIDFYKQFQDWEEGMITNIDTFTPEIIPKPTQRVSFKRYIRLPQKRVQNELFLHRPTRFKREGVVEVEVKR